MKNKSSIKAIILDVDGVIVGEKIGFNSPWPHPDVIKALKIIKSKGVSISLCTAKPHFSIDKIIVDAELSNTHITDGGGVIIDPIHKKIAKKHLIDSKSAKEVIEMLIGEQVYTEFYTVDDYFIQKSQRSEITKQHIHILQRNPKIVKSLASEALSQEITKIMPIAKDDKDKQRVSELLEPYENRLKVSWGVHPVALPLQFGIVTALGISKKQGAVEISKSIGVSFDNMLAVGDSGSDWQFIEPCKFGAAMGNASDELKKLVASKGELYSFVGPTVNENGVIEILKHFLPEIDFSGQS